MARIKDKLSAVEVRTARYKGKVLKLFDGGGLYLHIKPGGKYWRLKYRFGGKEKLLALGIYPEKGLKDAREGRDDARKLLDQGVDPSARRRATRAISTHAAANTLESVGREWWESVHFHQVKPTHSGRNLRRLELYIFPPLGRRPIAEISPGELLEALRRIEQSGRVDTAHRVRTLCSQVFRYAVATGRAEHDIASDLRDALRSTVTKHHAAIVSPEEIGPLLRAMDGYSGQPATRAALRLAPLLFVRPGELRQAEWKDLDLDAGEWNLTPSKGGEPLVVPLPRQAVEVLRDIEALTGQGRYVFPSAAGRGRPMAENTVNAALRRMDYKDIMTGHGFRAMARTVLVERLDYPAEHVEMQLAHAVRDPLGRAYNRTTYLDQRREMLQAWADYLDGLRDDGPAK
jgi:integrase